MLLSKTFYAIFKISTNSEIAPWLDSLRGIGLRYIWQHRNAVVYNDQQPDTLCIFKAKINQKVKTEFHIAKLLGKLENFKRDWTYHNLLTEIRNGVLILSF